jgi:hypothetical protein
MTLPSAALGKCFFAECLTKNTRQSSWHMVKLRILVVINISYMFVLILQLCCLYCYLFIFSCSIMLHIPCLYTYYIYMIHTFYILMFHIVMYISDIMIFRKNWIHTIKRPHLWIFTIKRNNSRYLPLKDATLPIHSILFASVRQEHLFNISFAKQPIPLPVLPICPSQFLQYRIEASPGSLSVGALPAACTSPWQWRLPPPSAPPRSLVLTCSLSWTLICPVCIPIFSLLPLLFSWF